MNPWGEKKYRLLLPKLLTAMVAVLMVLGLVVATGLNSGHAQRVDHGVALASDVRPRIPLRTSAPTRSSTVAATPTTGSVAANPGSASGLQVPSAEVPLPGQTTAGTAASGTAPAATATAMRTSLPVPTAQSLPTVTPLRTVDGPDAVALLPTSITSREMSALHNLRGVSAIELVDTGTVNLSGAAAVVFGVDPDTFRSFTPAASARSNQLWQYLAGGSLVSSYEMAADRSLKLGSELPLAPAGSSDEDIRAWLGAFASIGLPGVDLLVSHSYSAALGLTPSSGLVVSAPSLSGASLERELQSAVPGAAVELLHVDQVPDVVSGDTLNAVMRAKLVAAALSRVGMPYVWGATGPTSFDCSGLVQWSYRQAGILMPRVAAEQFLTGDHIPLADAQPGDLLFWTYDPDDPGYVDHTAIYLGNGMMVVAPHTGADVQVVPVATNELAGAVQVVLRHS